MSDTQDAARRLRRCRRMRGGILDCRCARCSAGRQVGTKGWFYSDRTKGWALELNSTAPADHAQFAELDAHNSRRLLLRYHRWAPAERISMESFAGFARMGPPHSVRSRMHRTQKNQTSWASFFSICCILTERR